MNAYSLAKPLLFQLPPETAHRGVHALLAGVQRTPICSLLSRQFTVADERLETSAFGQQFPNPVGLAAGFDKNAELPRAVAALGFGFVEVGGVTATPQEGNPRPRMFRLREDEGVINRMGLNNHGAATVGERIETAEVEVPLGVNVAKSEHVDPADAPADYCRTYEAVEAADFFVVNISCPNSQGFEELQNREAMSGIVGALRERGAAPLLVKLSPDLPEPAVDDALAIVEEFDLEGIVATNTSTERPASLQSPDRSERGGLSGKPIEANATETVRYVARRTDVPIVGVGGVATAEDAYRKIRAGASVIQLYTGLVFEGPTVARDINRGLLALLERDGFDSVEDAVGADLA